ncbi:MAG: SCO family protein [Alphaproteobacteria bacterium]|nr:SCO family protein [Alphaproteobacteria bacterium]MBV9370693.1 SCO family protein [Alphaproteobacteria bacterium]MBV9899894.1 SCO family protein [Alphaproteobacteria bacterium]
MNESTRSPIARRRAVLCALLLLGACSSPTAQPPLEGAHIGGPFTLTSGDGRTVTDRDFAGKYRIVYFGFTHCPDVCPTDLAALGEAMRRLERSDPKRAAKIQPLFISVDPQRDTPAVVKEYAAAFHPRILGLTGTPRQIAAVAKEYAVYYAPEPAQPGGGYGVDHSRVLLLMGPDGKPIALLPQDKGVDGIVAEIDRWVT